MNKFKWIIILLTASLTACAPPKKTPELLTDTQSISSASSSSIKTQNSSQQLLVPASATGQVPSSWDLSGAIAARSKNKSWTASVNWLQRGRNTYQIRLFGPLGSGTVLIERQGSTTTYRDGPKTTTSGNADELLKQQTGIRLPVNNLYYWVRGISAPGTVQLSKRDSYNRLILLRQAGFTIEYQGYQKVGNMFLPSLIRLQGNGVFIKFVIKRWNV